MSKIEIIDLGAKPPQSAMPTARISRGIAQWTEETHASSQWTHEEADAPKKQTPAHIARRQANYVDRISELEGQVAALQHIVANPRSAPPPKVERLSDDAWAAATSPKKTHASFLDDLATALTAKLGPMIEALIAAEFNKHAMRMSIDMHETIANSVAETFEASRTELVFQTYQERQARERLRQKSPIAIS